MQDSIILLTAEEFQTLKAQQAYYFTVNKDVKESNRTFFTTGYYTGCFNGVFLAFCGFLLYKLIKRIASKNNSLKTKIYD